MTDRGTRLHANAEQQIAELIGLLSTLDAVTLRRPCPGREKLGDGTVAALAQHTAENYQRIAAFVQTRERMSGAHQPTEHGGDHIPRALRSLGHGPAEHPGQGPGAGLHSDADSAKIIDPAAVVDQLSTARDTLARIAELTDSQLDAIPPKGSFRFCDGQRTLEQVLAGLLKHQSHQVNALKAAAGSQPGVPNSEAD